MKPRDLGSIRPFRPRPRRDDHGGTDRLHLSMNENPLGPSPAAIEAVRDAATRMHRYPASPHADLVAALATRWSVDPEQVWLGAGAVGVINALTRAMVEPGEAVLWPRPGFGYFGRSNRLHYGTDRTYRLDRTADFRLEPESLLESYDGEAIVYLNTPHNPTGATVSLETIAAVVDGTEPDTLVVVDEAYGPFTDEPSAIDLVDETDRVAILRTFSKAHGLAGMRVGYAIVPDELADAYGRVGTPFSVSQLSCVAARAALEDDDHLDRSVTLAREGRDRLRSILEVPTWPSAANFVLAEVGDGSAVATALDEEGIEVTDASSYGLDDCIRITVGTEAQTRRVASAINRVTA